MRALFKCEKVAELENCLYEARKKLRSYWASVLISLPDTSVNQYSSPFRTEYDLACQDIIFNCLSGFSGHITIFSEEVDSELVIGNSGEYYLLLDPLDGTHNAILGFPAFTTSAALYFENSYIFGWVYDLSRDLSYSAALGEGAYLQSPIIIKRLFSRDVSQLEDMRIAFHRPKSKIDRMKMRRIIWKADKIRVCSCSSLEICLIASGVLDAFIDISTPGHERSCDIAAAELILKEAGGSLFYASGMPRTSLSPSKHALSDYGTLIALSSEKLLHQLI